MVTYQVPSPSPSLASEPESPSWHSGSKTHAVTHPAPSASNSRLSLDDEFSAATRLTVSRNARPSVYPPLKNVTPSPARRGIASFSRPSFGSSRPQPQTALTQPQRALPTSPPIPNVPPTSPPLLATCISEIPGVVDKELTWDNSHSPVSGEDDSLSEVMKYFDSLPEEVNQSTHEASITHESIRQGPTRRSLLKVPSPQFSRVTRSISHASKPSSEPISSLSLCTLPISKSNSKASLAALWAREYATDALPDGSVLKTHPVDESISQNAGWYSLEEIIHLAGRSAMQNVHWNLPEDLIWRTLLTLLKDAALLHSGVTEFAPGQHNGPPDWQPVLHNSICPANIWYEMIDPEEEGPFGRCVLGRVTRCRVLSPQPDPNPTSESATLFHEFQHLPMDVDTAGFQAPEFQRSDPTNLSTGTKSDIWSIGAVILAMMTGANTRLFARNFTHDALDADNSVGEDLKSLLKYLGDDPMGLVVNFADKLADALPERFGIDLNSCVAMMLTRVPGERPQAVDVIPWIQEAYTKLPKVRKDGVRRIDWAMRGLRTREQERP